MIVRGMVAVACALAAAGCTPDASSVAVTVDEARKAAVKAGTSPADCPISFDVADALPGDQTVQPGEVEVLISKTSTPVSDPLEAQRDRGMSALDAAAGVSFDCRYKVGGKTVDAWFVATPGPVAITVMAPGIARAGHLDTTQLRDFLDHKPDPGAVALTPGGDAAVARIRIRDGGDGCLLVDPDGVVTGDALSKATKKLMSQIHF